MLFESGERKESRAIRENISPDAVRMLFDRHLSGDWGDISESDKKHNDEALVYGGRIFSGYFTGYGKIFIITEENRRSTRILFADEYRRS
ncbi:MAG TPA: hypothetical protein VN426_04160 [Syntrophomonadaceae bacterium]|nr:hypothetical protein [Syntrophomonadaceae bacterium]